MNALLLHKWHERYYRDVRCFPIATAFHFYLLWKRIVYYRSSLRNVLLADTIQDIIWFGHNAGNIEEMQLDYRSVRGYGTCPICQQTRNLLFNFVSDVTWMLYFERSNHSIQWLVSELPVTLTVNDATNAGQTVQFDLGYISLASHTREMSHLTSLQYFGTNWYYYDGLKHNGKLSHLKPTRGQWDKNNNYIQLFIKRKHLNIEGVFYFRR